MVRLLGKGTNIRKSGKAAANLENLSHFENTERGELAASCWKPETFLVQSVLQLAFARFIQTLL